MDNKVCSKSQKREIMIIVKIRGGLGNQMFQYIYGQWLMVAYPDVPVMYDYSVFNHENIHNGYELEKVFKDITVKQASPLDLKNVHVFYESGKRDLLSRIRGKANRKLLEIHERANRRRFNEFEWMNLSEDERMPYIEKCDVYLEGDWTVCPYYKTLLHSKINIFKFNKELLNRNDEKLEENLSKNNTTSLHVRGGDYRGTNFEFINREYYINALNEVRMIDPNTKVYVFTDDYEYAYSILGDECIYVKENRGKDSWKDMYLMSKCRFNIIANSTFSFWAAVLNEHEDKVVIAPQLDSENTNYYLPYDEKWVVL